MSSYDDKDFERTLENALEHASQWEGSPQAMFHNVRSKLQPKPWYQRIRPVMAFGATALSLMLALGIYHYASVFTPPSDQNPVIDIPVTQVLPAVGTVEKLRELVGENYIYLRDGFDLDESMKRNVNFYDSAAQSSKSGYSDTNIQVQGVDEADIVKTDGTHLYQIRGQEITISKIYPDTEMRVASRIQLPESIYPQELYVDGQYLTVVATAYVTENNGATNSTKRMIWGWYPQNTQILVYDITNKNAPVKSREVDVDGSVVSTRKVGSIVYLVAQKWLSSYDLEGEPIVMYRDSINGKDASEIGLDRICYFPEVRPEAYLTVLTLDLSDGKKEATVDVYLGSGRNIYMSKDNLYVAMEHWTESSIGSQTKTLVHKFNVAGTSIAYQGMGEVPGSILNQFSMDEHDRYFRIATTTRDEKPENNVYTLDADMKVVGTLEGLASGEQIYSVRFMGDKGYLVTFELIDPLFVIDLKDPANPQVLGELKIPGFSNYLHPIDENTLLGIGRDTEVSMTKGRPVVREKGLKLAIFDVSDVNNPKERHVEIIGDSGSYSEALHNHKAVLFHQGVLALPVYVMERGKLAFEGAVAYQISKEAGFASIGKVAHHYEHIARTLIINDVFYSISRNDIKANRLTNGLPDLATLTLQ